METISDFRFVQADGQKLTRQERTQAFEKGADLSSPSFLVIAYSWIHNGQGIDLTRNQDSVISATPLPDNTGILVEQSSTKYGPDNVVVLLPNGAERLRLTNPYRSSPDFKPGDQYRFASPRFRDGRLAIVNIEVSRPLAGKPYQWTPLYECIFDVTSWQLLKFEWVDSRSW